MNIFAVDQDPAVAAKSLCDVHVSKMLLETAQLLCGALPPNSFDGQYKRTHYNHPCAVWTRASRENFSWLVLHGLALSDEFSLRGKRHASERTVYLCGVVATRIDWPCIEFTPFAQAMPIELRSDDPVASYRRYYLEYKRAFAKWASPRTAPSWWKQEKQVYA